MTNWLENPTSYYFFREPIQQEAKGQRTISGLERLQEGFLQVRQSDLRRLGTAPRTTTTTTTATAATT